MRARSWKIVFVVAALAAVGGGVFFFLDRNPEAPSAESEAAPVADASVDGRAKVAKSKPGKKRKGRGAKTRVVGGHGAAGAGAHGGGAAGRSGGRAAKGGRGGAAPAGQSYEAAVGSNDQHLTMGANTGPDLTDAQLALPMSDGTFIDECGAPESMSVTVKVAIRMGRATGVSVYTEPPAAAVAGCIDRHVRGLSWPVHQKMDSFVTTY